MSILVLILVNWKYGSTAGLVSYIISLVIFIITEIFLILIVIWRKNGTIKSTNKPKAKGFACSGIVLSVITLISAIIAEIVIPSEQEKIEFPCRYYSYNNDQSNFSNRDSEYYRYLQTNDCKFNDYNYRTHKIKDSEIIAPYFCSSFLETFSLLLIMLWENEHRRVIKGVDGPLTDDNYGRNMQYPQGGIYGAQYPPYGSNQVYFRQVIIQQPYDPSNPQVYPPGSEILPQPQIDPNQQQGFYVQQGIHQANQVNKEGQSSQDQFYQGKQKFPLDEKYQNNNV